MEQERFVAFDVSQAETSVCVVDGPHDRRGCFLRTEQK
jgi:hypothetical protein